ncbi:MAG: hypothetical protein U9N87_00865 [Planctomycetota bacterium]|nr:hypothetical protein [Planctomycetota bacterium]
MELDPSLFSLEPPSGYTVNNMQATMPVEADLISTLRLVTQDNNGTFPSAIGNTKRMKPYIGLGMKCVRGLGFLRDLKSENDSHYVGGGVKLGTPDRPIFWYKPTGADKYRVIYADLSVKELTPDEVKKLPAAKDK